MPATTTTAIEMIDFAAEMGDRFPDKPDSEVLADVSEAFELEYDDVLEEDQVLSKTVLAAYGSQSTEIALQYARRTWGVKI